MIGSRGGAAEKAAAIAKIYASFAHLTIVKSAGPLTASLNGAPRLDEETPYGDPPSHPPQRPERRRAGRRRPRSSEPGRLARRRRGRHAEGRHAAWLDRRRQPARRGRRQAARLFRGREDRLRYSAGRPEH